MSVRSQTDRSGRNNIIQKTAFIIYFGTLNIACVQYPKELQEFIVPEICVWSEIFTLGKREFQYSPRNVMIEPYFSVQHIFITLFFFESA